MSQLTITIEGTLHPDGTLELDQMPSVSPGRVMVILQPATPQTSGPPSLASVLDDIRQGQQARGFQGRSAEEIDAALNEAEDAYEKRMS